MAKRKSISKKIRFEVFKRDGFACQYCGGTPPGAVLEVDHINPISKGGENDFDNFLTACFDCNRGKANILLSELPKTVIEKAALLEEKEAQLKEFKKLLRLKKTRITREVNRLNNLFESHFENRTFTESTKASVRNNLLPNFNINDLEFAMDRACLRVSNPTGAIKYFFGICWTWRKTGVSYGKK